MWNGDAGSHRRHHRSHQHHEPHQRHRDQLMEEEEEGRSCFCRKWHSFPKLSEVKAVKLNWRSCYSWYPSWRSCSPPRWTPSSPTCWTSLCPSSSTPSSPSPPITWTWCFSSWKRYCWCKTKTFLPPSSAAVAHEAGHPPPHAPASGLPPLSAHQGGHPPARGLPPLSAAVYQGGRSRGRKV